MTLDDTFLKALGRISVNFQTLEYMLAYFVWILIGPDIRIGQVITTNLSFNRLCEIMRGIFPFRVQNQILVDELETIIKKALNAEAKQNTVIHSAWLTSDTSKGKTKRLKITTSKGELKYQFDDMDINELNKTADFILEAYDGLASLMHKVKVGGYVVIPDVNII